MSDPKGCDRCGQPHERCKAHNRQGQPCGLWPLSGQRVCKLHGGGKPAARANAERNQQEAAAAEVVRRRFWQTDAAPITDPILALQRFTGRLEVMLDELGGAINGLEQLHAEGTHQSRVELLVWQTVARELRQGLEAMARLGIEDRVTAVLEAQGEQVYELVRSIGRALLAELVQLLAEQPAALGLLEESFERLYGEAARAELGALHELESGSTGRAAS